MTNTKIIKVNIGNVLGNEMSVVIGADFAVSNKLIPRGGDC